MGSAEIGTGVAASSIDQKVYILGRGTTLCATISSTECIFTYAHPSGTGHNIVHTGCCENNVLL